MQNLFCEMKVCRVQCLALVYLIQSPQDGQCYDNVYFKENFGQVLKL